jgi:hypothetical protein
MAKFSVEQDSLEVHCSDATPEFPHQVNSAEDPS